MNIRQKQKSITNEYPDFPLGGFKKDSFIHFTFVNDFLTENSLNEFLNRTISPNKTIDTLKSRFEFNNVTLDENNIDIELEKRYFFNIPTIIKFMDSFGWFPASVNGKKFIEDDIPKYYTEYNYILIAFEAKYDTEIDFNGDYLYHVTNDLFIENIKQYGLFPKSKNKLTTHPQRIYLAKDLESAKKITGDLHDKNPNKQHVKEYLILKIDYRSIQNKIKLYQDPNYEDGLYTTDLIAPKYIEPVGKVTVK